ncbi:MAG: hypothetical protein ABUS79_21045, partial [Pseudomonadota bacterium]
NLVTLALLGGVARITVAAGVMAAAIWPLARWLPAVAPHGLAGNALAALAPITVGAAVYFLTARLLGLPEARTLLRRLR